MTSLSRSLIRWYSHNKRNLPWRDTKNPYNIWVSEIILQQTRVNQGLNYYYRFIETFPDIQTLANSDIDILLKLWQGLGYYTRARNMHITAQEITKNLNNQFPSNYNDLIKLKGIGDYTASAIASISFNEKTPVLDGNVFRVISRIFGIAESTQTSSGKKIFKEKLLGIIPEDDPGTFNQAIMEFGALQCVPQNPDCQICPFIKSCFAHNNDMIGELPLKKQKVKQKDRYFNYLLITHDKFTFVEQRQENDIWKLLYQLPLIETDKKVSLKELIKNKNWIRLFKNTEPEIDFKIIEKKHILSHQKIHASLVKLKINKPNSFILNNYKKVQINELQKLGVPKLLENFLKEINN